MNSGYVRLHRSLLEKNFYKKPQYNHLWTHLILKATYKEKEYIFNERAYILKPGQFITGRKRLSNETGIPESNVQRILKFFENEHMIEQQSHNKFRIITICNWGKYQADEQQGEHSANNQRTAGEQPADTINKEKKDKNIKKEKNSNLPNEEDPEPPVVAPEGFINNILQKVQERKKTEATEPCHSSTQSVGEATEPDAFINGVIGIVSNSIGTKTPKPPAVNHPLNQQEINKLRRTNPELFAEENRPKPSNPKVRRNKQ